MAHHPLAAPPPLDHSLPPRSHHHPPPPQQQPNGVHLPPPPPQSHPSSQSRHMHSHSQVPPPPPPHAVNGQLVSPAQSHRAPNTGAGPQRQPGPLPTHMASSLQRLSQGNEETWILIGNIYEQMNDPDRAENAYENALRHNPDSERALTQVASIARSRDDFVKAIEFFQRALDCRQENGEVWSALGHCYLMQDDLQKAYAAYQQALYHLPNPKDPKLWYGIGILYDRYGSLDNAEEAFASVLRMDANFEKAEEILFRLGIIYKQQQKYPESLDCFDRILRNPPAPLANLDIWFQIGHVYEQAKNYEQAKEAYERVLADSPNHAKVLQQLGWLYHQPGSTFANQDMAIQCLTKSLEADPSDAQSWYLLGRAYMAVQKYQKAYEAYQQAVYRDGRNPTFWCSIGVLYYNINQYRDALDAYSRAIRINPYIPEVWFDLGSLYESCNNQISDAIDAYARAADLDPNNQVIKTRLRMLKDVQANGGTMPAAPGPQDVHPTAYASGHGPPSMIVGHGQPGGPHTPLASHHQPSGPAPGPAPHRPPSHSRSNSRTNGMHDSMMGGSARDLPAPGPSMRGGRGSAEAYRHPPDTDPFRGGAPPPLNIDDTVVRRNSGGHAPMPAMELERHGAPHYPEPPRTVGGPSHGPPPPLHHPVPQPPLQPINDMAPPPGPGGNGPLPSLTDRTPYDQRPIDGPTRRQHSPSESPRVGSRRATNPNPSPVPYSSSYRNSSYPQHPPTPHGLPPPISSAHHGLPYDRGTATSTENPERHQPHWDRRQTRTDPRNAMDGPPPPPGFRSPAPSGTPYGPPSSHHGRPPSAHSHERRGPSPNVPRNEYFGPDRRETRSPQYWSGQHHSPPGPPPRRPVSPPPPSRRYDPRFDGEPPRRPEPGWERDPPHHPPRSEAPPPLQQPLVGHPPDRNPDRTYNATPDTAVKSRAPPALTPATTGGASAVPAPQPPPTAENGKWRESEARWRERESESPRPGSRATVEPPKERKRRGGKADKDVDSGTPKPTKEKKERKASTKRSAGKTSLVEKEEGDRGSIAPLSTAELPQAPPFKAPSNWLQSSSSSTSQVISHRPNRSVDEDYDEEEPEREDSHNGAAAALMGLAGYRSDSRPSLPPPPPVGVSRSASGGIHSLLNGPSSGPARGPVDRVRTPVGRTNTPLKRGASAEHGDATDRKRSRLDSNGSSSSAGSPGHSPNSNRGAPPLQSRRTSMDTRSDSQGRRSRGEGVEHDRKAQSPAPAQAKRRSNSPRSRPPIATLTPPPVSPTTQKSGPMHIDGPSVPSPSTSAKHSPLAETS